MRYVPQEGESFDERVRRVEDQINEQYVERTLRPSWYVSGALVCYLCAKPLPHFHVRGGTPNLCKRCGEDLSVPFDSLQMR